MTTKRSSEKTSQHIAADRTLTIEDNAAHAAPTVQDEENAEANLPSPQTAEHNRGEAWNLQEFYQVSYTVVSIVFFAPLVGYVLSGILNTRLHSAVGQRGIAVLCGGSHLVSALINCLHPPYPLLVISFMIAGLGNGLSDSVWNAWIGNLPRATELLGFMHACYGVGAVISPLIATAMITRYHLPWYTYYYVMARSAWLSALFVLVYVGVEYVLISCFQICSPNSLLREPT
ncbi:hypothetical protein SLS63_008570 [Diaporthe eres]|uniref:Major facilitator superfamily (MFS) profile domain-containing protein n=1 Tax=Diaporthe eres TaxID=83184 RepID=A0ABR1P293_DIAER